MQSEKQIRRVRAILSVWLSALLLVRSIVVPVTIAQEIATSSGTEAETVMATGDTYATAESTSLTAVTLDNSGLQISTDDILGEETQDIILTTETPVSTCAPEFEPSGESTPSGSEAIVVSNDVVASTAAIATSSSGTNTQITDTGALMTTGDAVASAYATSITNTTLIDSTLQVAFLSVFSDWDGNLVLDPMEFAGQTASWGVVTELEVDNTGEIVTSAQAAAVSGSNTQIATGEAEMVTGGASAVAAGYAVTSLTSYNAAILDLFVQNMWLWSGNVYNFLGPGSVQTPDQVVGRNIAASTGGCLAGCSRSIDVENTVKTTTTAIASASTGENLQVAQGGASLTTGQAAASAQALSMSNITLVNTDYRFLGINLLAPWTGNLIFAYPDLSVSIVAPPSVKAGEPIKYQVVVKNEGYKTAREIKLSGLETSGTWQSIPIPQALSELGPGEHASWEYEIPTTGLSGTSLEILAQVVMTDQEVSLDNNSASAAVTLTREQESEDQNEDEQDENESDSSDGESTGAPKLVITASNNINEYIFAGDSVRYEVKVNNQGNEKVTQAVLYQDFVSPEGEVIGGLSAEVGEITPGKERTIRFVMQTSRSLTPGMYTTETWVTGLSNAGHEVSSPKATNTVPIRSLVAGTTWEELPTVMGEVYASEQVLGVSGGDTAQPDCQNCKPWLWYLAVSILSTIYFASLIMRVRFRHLVSAGLVIPLGVYGLFILSNPGCNQGLVIVSSDLWCKWFLVVVDLIYLIPGVMPKLVTKLLQK